MGLSPDDIRQVKKPALLKIRYGIEQEPKRAGCAPLEWLFTIGSQPDDQASRLGELSFNVVLQRVNDFGHGERSPWSADWRKSGCWWSFWQCIDPDGAKRRTGLTRMDAAIGRAGGRGTGGGVKNEIMTPTFVAPVRHSFGFSDSIPLRSRELAFPREFCFAREFIRHLRSMV
jgi:hypothetical protein